MSKISRIYWVSWIFLAVIFAGLDLYFSKSLFPVTIERIQLENSDRSTVSVFRHENREIPNTVAILLHGKRCSAQLMAPLARVLAINGIKTYSFDFPGHGKSPVPMTFRCNIPGLGLPICHKNRSDIDIGISVVQSLIDQENLSNKKIIFIGHSFGGGRIGHSLMNSPQLSNLDKGLINLDGNVAGTIYRGPRLLTLHARTKQPSSNFGEQIQLDISHFEMIINSKVVELILNWINENWRGTLENSEKSTAFHLSVPVTAVFILLTMIFMTYSLISELGSTQPFASRVRISDFIILIFSSVASALAIRLGVESITFLKLHNTSESLYLIYFILLGLSSTTVILIVSKEKFRMQRFNYFLKAVSIGVLAFLPLALFAAPYVDHHLFHSSLSETRFLRWGAFSLFFYPLCFVTRRLSISKTIFQSYLLRMGIWIFLLTVWFLFQPPRDINRPPIGDLLQFSACLVIIEIFAARLERKSNSITSSAVFASLALAWIAAIFYPFYAT
ncbi:MAG: alpha/beta hydrolase [Bdellovibrionales bacterium]|nr:alpha/beta hydrolase [Bdellovibrionales bacterium]